MASLRQIRSRLRSIQNTKQIMRAMQLVSGSKLKRAQGKLIQARATLEFLDGLLQRVLAAEGRPERSRGTSTPSLKHPLCASSTPGPSTLVLFTSDTGLCGSYNTNLIQMAESFLNRDSAASTQIVYIGKKGHRHFTKRGPSGPTARPPDLRSGRIGDRAGGRAAAAAYLDLAGRPDLAKAEAIGRALMEQFLLGATGSVHLLYSRFLSATVYRPTLMQWLPIQLAATSQSPSHPVTQSPADKYIFEPSPARVFEDLLPRWALAKFQLVMLEAFTSEHSARMIAMKNATDNAEEILKALTTQRNKIRQASITKEISEIVGTAEALK